MPTDAKISALTALAGASIADTDLIPIVDVSDTTMAASGTDKYTTPADLEVYFAARTAVYNTSVSTPGAGFASDTYLVGSSIAIPAGRLMAKSIYRVRFSVTKTAAGTAGPVVTVRFGTNGSTADTARATLTFAAQTAATDEGLFEILVTFRTVGSGTAAVINAVGTLAHHQSITGLGTSVTGMQSSIGGGFDSTVANSIIGLSVNGGASAAWTIDLVQAELTNLN